MTVLTISRQSGSDGRRIAEAAAQTLGYHFVHKDTLEQILVQYGFVEFYKDYDAASNFWDRLDANKTELIHMLNQTVRGLARHGRVVILGRGSFAVLHGLADVLNVRLQAPLPLRVARVMAREQMANRDEAEAVVVENDRRRAAFVHTFYGVRWDATDLFDLVIDTGKVTPDVATAWLVQAVRALPDPAASPELSTRGLEEDAIMAAAIAKTFNEPVEA
jgi:cytidylate kinase